MPRRQQGVCRHCIACSGTLSDASTRAGIADAGNNSDQKSIFFETEQYHLIASSVLDSGWMAQVVRHKGPFLFMAEGVFRYLDGNDVRLLVLEIQEKFRGSDLVCEVVNSVWLISPLKF